MGLVGPNQDFSTRAETGVCWITAWQDIARMFRMMEAALDIAHTLDKVLGSHGFSAGLLLCADLGH